jgi:hypothetical protein
MRQISANWLIATLTFSPTDADGVDMRGETHARHARLASRSDFIAIVVEDHACMIGCSAVVIRSICAGVVMLLSSRLKCTCCTPETMYCQR